MANVIIGPDENATPVARHNQSVIAQSEVELEAGVKAHLRSYDQMPEGRVRPANADLDKFRHLFGPKRRGR